MLKNLQFLKRDAVLVGILFLVVVVVYIVTLCPTIYLGDSGELIAAAQSLGIAHPSGYPLFVLLGKLFSFIPIGSVAWRVNLMSAVFSAAAVAVLFLIFRRLKIGKLISWLVALAFSLTTTLWSQSVTAEVYSLNLFLFALAFYLLLRWRDSKKDSHFYWLCFIFGLSLTNHLYLMAAVAPVFLLSLFIFKKDWWRGRRLWIGLLLLILGLSFYLYMPLRSLSNPAIDYGNPENLSNFGDTLLRKPYSDLGDSGIDIESKSIMLVAFGEIIWENFGMFLVLIGVVGLLYLVFKDKKILIITLALFTLGSIGIIMIRSLSWGFILIEMFKVYYLPVFLVFAIWVGYGFAYFHERLNKYWPRSKYVPVIFSLLLIIAPLMLFIENYHKNDLSDFYLEHNFTYNLLESLEPEAVLVIYEGDINQDNLWAGFLYWQIVEGFREDVLLQFVAAIDTEGEFRQLADSALSHPDYKEGNVNIRRGLVLNTVAERIIEQRPVYATFLADDIYWARSNGYAYRYFKNEESAREYEPTAPKSLYDPEKRIPWLDLFSQDLLAKHHYVMANYYLENDDNYRSYTNLIQAINLDNESFSADYQNFVQHRSKWSQ
ncbi:MAG: DUF2723 domain-containing protein [Patescibacteria group bacterium]